MIETIEKKFLLSTCRDPEKLLKAHTEVPFNTLLTSEGRFLYEKIVEYFNQYKILPTKTVFKLWISKVEDSEFKNSLIAYFESISNTTIQEGEFQFYIDSLKKNKVYNDALDTIERFSNTVEKDKIIDQINNLQTELSRIGSSSNKKVDYYNLSENVNEQVRSFHCVSESNNGIPTPIEALNNAIGGLKPAQLNIIAGVSGSGKSIFLLNFSEYAYRLGYNVVYFTIEMSYQDCLNRYHSLITQFPANAILHNTLSDEDKKIFYHKLYDYHITDKDSKKKLNEIFKKDLKELGISPTEEEIKIYGNEAKKYSIDRLFEQVKDLTFRSNQFYIVDAMFGLNVYQLKSHINNLSRKGKVDLVVVDYLNLMNSGLRGLQDWEDAKHVSRALKTISREFNLPVLTAVQLSSATKDERISQNDVRYSKAINENADNVIAFKRNDKDELLNIIRLELIKHRHGKSEVITVKEDFNRISIQDVKTNGH
jgi:replicative DNA helicase